MFLYLFHVTLLKKLFRRQSGRVGQQFVDYQIQMYAKVKFMFKDIVLIALGSFNMTGKGCLSILHNIYQECLLWSGLDIIISCHVCNSLSCWDLAAYFICWKLVHLLHLYELLGFILSGSHYLFCFFVPEISKPVKIVCIMI